MDKLLFILTGAALLAFVLAVIFGRYPKAKDTEIIWTKLDEHEKALGE
jgi:hypothetical protein